MKYPVFADVCSLDMQMLRLCRFLRSNRDACLSICWPTAAAEGIDKPVLAGCIGPYSLAGRLYDMTEIMMAIYTEPDTVLLLLEKCTEFILRYCLAIKETGVAGVIMAEPAAGLLSNEDCQRYSSVYVKRIIDAVQMIRLQLFCIIAVTPDIALLLCWLPVLKGIISEIKRI